MLGYYYPNEAAEPLLWHPVLFAYTLLVSGADLLILAALAYLTGSLRKAIPLMTMLGIGFFAVVLAGPLADLRSPHRHTSSSQARTSRPQPPTQASR